MCDTPPIHQRDGSSNTCLISWRVGQLGVAGQRDPTYRQLQHGLPGPVSLADPLPQPALGGLECRSMLPNTQHSAEPEAAQNMLSSLLHPRPPSPWQPACLVSRPVPREPFLTACTRFYTGHLDIRTAIRCKNSSLATAGIDTRKPGCQGRPGVKQRRGMFWAASGSA